MPKSQQFWIHPSILQHCGTWGAAIVTVLNVNFFVLQSSTFSLQEGYICLRDQKNATVFDRFEVHKCLLNLKSCSKPLPRPKVAILSMKTLTDRCLRHWEQSSESRLWHVESTIYIFPSRNEWRKLKKINKKIQKRFSTDFKNCSMIYAVTSLRHTHSLYKKNYKEKKGRIYLD